jgi:ankyrin repeat protein
MRDLAIGVLLACGVAAGAWTTRLSGAAPDPPLVEAAKSSDEAAVRRLLQRRSDVNVRALDGSTALHWAVHRDNANLVASLLKAGADVEVRNRYGVTPLALAAENGNPIVLERLLAAGANPNASSPHGGETVLMTAARTGNAQALKVLLAHKADVHAKEPSRDQTALMWAAARGNTEAVVVLLEAGADLHARSTEIRSIFQSTYVTGVRARIATTNLNDRVPGFTPLLFAVRGGHTDTVRTLLDAGASVNDTAGPDKTSALVIACANASWELGALLMERGADPNADGGGRAPLHEIARTRSLRLDAIAANPPPPAGSLSSLDLVKRLLARGAKINARNRDGLTPLMAATNPPDTAFIRLLLASGADPTIPAPNGTTALAAAAGVGLAYPLPEENKEPALEAVRLLLESGLDVNAANDQGDTAMHGAATMDYPPLVQVLADHGARLDPRNARGFTPLMSAHADFLGNNLQIRPKAEAALRKLYEARGIPLEVLSPDEVAERMVWSGRGPEITCPASQRVRSSGGRPTVVTYPPPTTLLTTRQLDCSPKSGAEFPVGTSMVTCTAMDHNYRTDTCTVLMRVLP